jgi:hypothetical protein
VLPAQHPPSTPRLRSSSVIGKEVDREGTRMSLGIGVVTVLMTLNPQSGAPLVASHPMAFTS